MNKIESPFVQLKNVAFSPCADQQYGQSLSIYHRQDVSMNDNIPIPALNRVMRDRSLETKLYQCAAADFYGLNVLGTPAVETFMAACPAGRGCSLVYNSNILALCEDAATIGPDPLSQSILPPGCFSSFRLDDFQAEFPILHLARIAASQSIWTDPHDLADIAFGQYVYRYLHDRGIDMLQPGRFRFFPVGPANAGSNQINGFTPDGIFHHRIGFYTRSFLPALVHLDFAQSNGHNVYVFREPQKPVWISLFLPYPLPAVSFVFLTDEVGIGLSNPNCPDYDIFGFFEDDSRIESLDVEPFRGKDLFWILLDENGPERKQRYQKTVSMMGRFKRANIPLDVLHFHGVQWNTSNSVAMNRPGGYQWVKISTAEEIVRMAENLGCVIPQNLRHDRYGLIDWSRQTDRCDLLKGFIAPGDIVLIEEFSGIAPFQTTRILLSDLASSGAFGGAFGERYPAAKSLSSLLCITPGKERRFCHKDGDVAGGDFLKFPPEKAVQAFSGLLDQTNPDLVLFDTDWLFDPLNRKTVEAVFSRCRSVDIGVVIIFNRGCHSDEPAPWIMHEADRHFAFMPLTKEPGRFVVERLPGHAHKEHFGVDITSGRSVQFAISDAELMAIPER